MMANLWDLLKQHATETYDTLSQGKVGQDLRADANKIKTGGTARLEQLANMSPQDAAMNFGIGRGLQNSNLLTKYNKALRPVYGDDIINLSGSHAVSPSNNILYRPDRAYRTLGQGGYNDFLDTGLIRAKPVSKQSYQQAFFSKGVTDPRYMRKGGDKYIVESLFDDTWGIVPTANSNHPYLKAPQALQNTSPIRVFEKQTDGSYRTVFDNIKDAAFWSN